ncbi:unnamed protein product [Adineta steineri]|uniref:Fork-head domain-containing protein n=1 Tax=Adineta steineri TaxID=433720 RepID=A0A814LGI6_9BILA|nr:unnamed protein product [Adineta steineri]
MMMHNGPSGVLSSCDLLVDITDGSNNSMVNQHQSDSHQYHHPHYPHNHSDSSRSSSVCSSSLSPKTSSSTTLTTTVISSATVPTGTVTTTLTDVDPQLAQHVEYELGLTKKNGSGTRKNAWGNLSYAELISKAITSSAEQRLTLSEIYDWMIKYVPFFRNKVDRISSAGWKNSIRHNLSLHNRFKRVQSEGTGKSSWWMINPDDKSTCGSGSLSSPTSIKQPRRRLGQGAKSASLSSPIPPKRLRGPRNTKATRALTAAQRSEQQQQLQQQQHQNSGIQQLQSSDMSAASVYEVQQWQSQLDTDNTNNHLYEQDLYAASVNTPTTNSNGNSTACIQSTYSYDDVATNYLGNTSSTNNNNTGDYSYHHPHHFHSHPHHSHTLYQHHHGSNYDTGATSGYYCQQSVLNDHHSNPCSLPLDTYHTNNPGNYSLQQQQQQQQIDPNDEQIYLRVHSISSHSSTSSLSPPTLTTNNNLLPSSSSGSNSSNYTHPHKTSSSGGYLHPTSNETLTLYSHHHQHLSHHSDIEPLLDLNTHDDDIDDDDDLSTLVHHHHGMIEDQQQLSSFFPNNHNHQVHSHNDTSNSLLRTVLNRPIVDMYNQQV